MIFIFIVKDIMSSDKKKKKNKNEHKYITHKRILNSNGTKDKYKTSKSKN